VARSSLTALLRNIHAAHLEAEMRDLPPDVVFDEHEARRIARREFLTAAGATAATVFGIGALGTALPIRAFAKAAHAPRIVIVGGGLAGVTCAYRLWQAGIASTLYEANANVGGRTWTLRGFFDDGQIAENGGEFISSEHKAIAKLAGEMGLDLIDLRAAQKPGTEEVYWVHGKRVAYREMLAEYAAVFPKLKAANDAADYPTLYNRYNHAAWQLDHMSAREWVIANVPGGLQSTIGWMLDIDATTENGGEASEQSALELIYMLGHMPAYNPAGGFYWVGTDERYGVKGGNDQVVHRMASRLPASAIRTSSALVALRRRSDGSYACTFESQLQTFDVAADYVVLALPFTTLRRCDLSKAEFSSLKMTAIQKLPMGTNTKIYMQFKARPWYAMGYNGATYADTGYQQTLEATRGQAGKSGILEFYSGGDVGKSFGPATFAPADPAVARKQLAGLEPLYPGITAAWNGKAFMDYWTGDPWHRGSYSYWGVGHETLYAGMERVRQGNALFCGEHTAIDFSGFMNGAVLTGEICADVIESETHARAGAQT
jgi:monoamine oxidase